MKFLNRNLLVLHLVLIVGYLTWVHAGSRVEHLVGIPWLSLVMLELVLLLPQRRVQESLFDAQRRVLAALVRDPLFYCGVTLLALLTLQWANGGGGVTLDRTNSYWVYGVPKIPWLPSSVSSDESRQQLYWFLPVFAALMAVRHGMLRGAQKRLLSFMVWNGAALALFGFIQMLTGTQSLWWITALPGYFFSTFGYTNVAGAFFTLMFAVSFGLWLQSVVDTERRMPSEVWLIPVALNFAGALGSLSRAAMLLTLILLLTGLIYSLFFAWRQIGLGARLKILIFGSIVVVLTAALFKAFPNSNLKTELSKITPSTFYDETIGVRHFQYRSAWEMFKDYPLFGVGGWGYRHYARLYVTPEAYLQMIKGKGMANVHNDPLQFLAEHGAVGFGLMLASVVFLLLPIARGARLAARPEVVSDRGLRKRKTPYLLRIPPVAICVCAGTAATFVHSMIDLPFRLPSFLIAWTLALACTPAFLPRKKAPVVAAETD